MRVPTNATTVARMLHGAGVYHLVTVDLHTAQIEGFFHIPVDSLSAVPVLCAALRDRLPTGTVVISPDEGRVKTATAYARLLGATVGVVHSPTFATERRNRKFPGIFWVFLR
jgi:ribose-phosphate pyrophosphokinase